MNLAQETIVAMEAALPRHESFDDDVDKWDGMVAKADKNDSGLQAALKAAKGQPTKKGFDAFKKAVLDIKAAQLKVALIEFTRKIGNGDFKDEFPRIDGRGSAVAELFSVFRQSMR